MDAFGVVLAVTCSSKEDCITSFALRVGYLPVSNCQKSDCRRLYALLLVFQLALTSAVHAPCHTQTFSKQVASGDLLFVNCASSRIMELILPGKRHKRQDLNNQIHPRLVQSSCHQPNGL